MIIDGPFYIRRSNVHGTVLFGTDFANDIVTIIDGIKNRSFTDSSSKR